MKTIKFFITFFLAILLISCETGVTQKFKNNGPTLVSRLCGSWNSISITALGVAPENEVPNDCFDYKVNISSDMVYTEYYQNTMLTQKTFTLNDTIYNKQNDSYSGNIILEDSLIIHFSIIKDNLYLTPIQRGEDLVIGGYSIRYKKEF
jgi:hypothetical protein